MEFFNAKELSKQGLNLQAVFNLDQLPDNIFSQLSLAIKNIDHFSQLILIGHGGKLLWRKIKDAKFQSDNMIDDFSYYHVEACLKKQVAQADFEIIFPSKTFLPLQSLGELAGWHHPSPFKVGINQQWGSWFAYRAVVLVKSNFSITEKIKEPSPCLSCNLKPCTLACPAKALENNSFNLERCIKYRKQQNSSCKNNCLARVACPIGKQHQYSQPQINYHYSLSMKAIEAFK